MGTICKLRLLLLAIITMVAVGSLAQEGIFAVQFTNITFPSEGGVREIKVDCNVSWEAVSDVSWLAISNGSGQGSGSFKLMAEPNPSSMIRTAVLTISGEDSAPAYVEVTQDPFIPYIIVTPTSMAFDSSGGSRTVDVISNVSWTAVSDADWLKISGSSGNGDGRFTVSADPYSGNEIHVATVKVFGVGADVAYVEVTMLGCNCPNPIVSPTTIVFEGEGGEKSVMVSTNIAWTAESDADWLKVSDVGNWEFTLSADANTTGQSRSAIVTVSGDGAESAYVEVTQLPNINLIVSPKAGKRKDSRNVYDLQGKSISKDMHGIYISNGKKIMK